MTTGYMSCVNVRGQRGPDEWIEAVQANSYTGLSDMVTFDGFVTRCEFRF